MKNKVFLAFLLGLLAFGMSNAFSITNGNFENVQDGYSDCYYSNCVNLSSLFPTSWEIYLPVWTTAMQENVDEGVMLAGVNVDSNSGVYSYSNAYFPDLWNDSFSANYGSFYTIQDLSGLVDNAKYRIKGYYKIVSDDLLNSSFANFGILTDSVDIEFNKSNLDTWTYFEVEYDDGSCSVISGDVNITDCYNADMPSITIYSSFVFEQAQDYGLNHTEVLFLVDDLSISLYTTLLNGVGDFYDTAVLPLESFGYDTFTYGSGNRLWLTPSSSQVSVYQGRIMDSMKEKYIEVRFTNSSYYTDDYSNCLYRYVGSPNISYWNGTAWRTENSYHGFESNCMAEYCFTDYTPFQTPTFTATFIVPKEARDFRIMFEYVQNSEGCGTQAVGRSVVWFNSSDAFDVNSTDEIDTSNALQSNPTFFPILTQFVQQDSKNLTAYFLNLVNYKNHTLAYKIYWETQEMTSDTTGSMWNQSYYSDYYDTSGWAILSNDTIWYNGTSTWDFFGVSYVPSSLFYFDYMEGICEDYCDEGDFYDGTAEGLSCSYEVDICNEDCIREDLNLNLTSGTDWINAYFLNVGTTNYNYELRKLNTGELVANGTPLSYYANLTGLESGIQYAFYLNGTGYYACDSDYSIYGVISTLSYSEIPDEYAGYVEDLGDSLKGIVSAITGFFYFSFGFSETLSKALIWIALTIIISVIVGLKLGEGAKSSGMIISGIMMLILGFLLNWLPLGIGIIFIVLTGAVGIMILKKAVV